MQILLADDHGLFRDSLELWLKQLGDDTRIHTVASYQPLMQALQSGEDFDLILSDLSMPGMQGVASIHAICKAADWTPVLVISANQNPETIAACLSVGAAGYLTKSAEGDELLQAIRQVLDGSTFAPPVPAHAQLQFPAFSPRQLELLHCLTRGLSNKQIADELSLSVGTIKQYVSNILDKLEVSNRTQAGLRAREILGIDNAV